MIIVNLKGGLGNQMFQYALGRNLAKKNNDQLKLYTGGLTRANEVGDIYRPFSLEKFNIQKDISSKEETRKLKYPYGILSKLWRFISLQVLKINKTIWNPKVMDKTGDIFLDGYWQSPRYFSEIRPTLLKEFSLKNPLSTSGQKYLSDIQNTESVAVHIRRGDYANNPQVLREFGVCSPNYYEKAVAKIQEAHANAQFFIFSDDIDWVKNNLKISASVTYVEDPSLSDADELYLMSQAKHNIIANSSFSWWSAWLNDNDQKIVVAPDPWFEKTIYDKDLIPASWIKIKKN